jgi:hypothetical protein
MSVPQRTTHYSPARSGDVLDTVVHRYIISLGVIVSDIPDSVHLPIFHVLDHVKTKNPSKLIEETRRLGKVSKLGL